MQVEHFIATERGNAAWISRAFDREEIAADAVVTEAKAFWERFGGLDPEDADLQKKSNATGVQLLLSDWSDICTDSLGLSDDAVAEILPDTGTQKQVDDATMPHAQLGFKVEEVEAHGHPIDLENVAPVRRAEPSCQA